MWDEKQFFKDFAEEAHRIIPDAEFANRLKKQVTEENLVKLNYHNRKLRYVKYMAAAAILLLAIGIGKLGLFTGNNENLLNMKNHAGKEIDGQPNEDMENLEEDHIQVISMLKDHTVMVDDAYGNTISEEKRNELLEIISKVRRLENEQLQKDFWENGEKYYCVGEQTISFIVVQDKYVKIEETEYGLEE